MENNYDKELEKLKKESFEMQDKLVQGSREFGMEVFDTELARELVKLDLQKKYKPTDIADLVKRAKKRAEKKLEELK